MPRPYNPIRGQMKGTIHWRPKPRWKKAVPGGKRRKMKMKPVKAGGIKAGRLRRPRRPPLRGPLRKSVLSRALGALRKPRPPVYKGLGALIRKPVYKGRILKGSGVQAGGLRRRARPRRRAGGIRAGGIRAGRLTL